MEKSKIFFTALSLDISWKYTHFPKALKLPIVQAVDILSTLQYYHQSYSVLMSLAFSRGDIWNRGDPKRGAYLPVVCLRSPCGVPAFAVGTMTIPKESAVDTNSETVSSYAIGSAMTRARTITLLNFSQCSVKQCGQVVAINRHINTHFNYYIYCLPGYTGVKTVEIFVI